MLSRTRTQRGLKVGLIAATIAGLVLVAGCSGRGADTGAGTGDEAEGRDVSSFAIVTPEKESDHGWNQQGLRAAQAAADELGIELQDNSNVGYDNTETILTQIADGGADFIIAPASGLNAAGPRGGLTSGVPVLVVDFGQAKFQFRGPGHERHTGSSLLSIRVVGGIACRRSQTFA